MTVAPTRNQPRRRSHAPAPPLLAVPVRAVDLRPGHAVRIAGYGTIPVTRTPAPAPADLVAVHLGWDGLSLVVHPATPLDAFPGEPGPAYRVWTCRHCAGTGLWQGEGKASNGGR